MRLACQVTQGSVFFLRSGVWSLAAACLCLACSASKTAGEPGLSPALELPETQLSVSVTCTDGVPEYRDVRVLVLPSEEVFWRLASYDSGCRIYGAIVARGTRPEGNEPCNVRFRSRDVVSDSDCGCVEGTFLLDEGRLLNDECCRRFPDGINCRTD